MSALALPWGFRTPIRNTPSSERAMLVVVAGSVDDGLAVSVLQLVATAISPAIASEAMQRGDEGGISGL
jgi:hypothetical protein